MTLAVLLAFALPILPSQAQTAPPQSARSYSIAAGPLEDVLTRFTASAGIALSFDPALVAGLHSAGLSGSYTGDQGLRKILQGSGLAADAHGDGSYTLRKLPATGMQAESTLAPVTVTTTLYGSRETSVLNDSTASVGIVTADDIEDGQIRTFREGFRRLGNVMDSAYVSSGFVIRGMSSEGFVPGGTPVGSLYIDGVLQTRVNARRAPRSLWDAEQVEVYRGPQSTLSGRAAMTGAIYLKSKDPVFRQEAEISGTVGSDRLAGTAFMVNTPLVADEVAMRITGSYERSTSPVSFPTYTQFSNYDEYRTDLSYNLRGKILFAPKALPNTTALFTYAVGKENPADRFIGANANFGLDAERGDFYQWPTYAEYRPLRTQNAALEITHALSDRLKFTSSTGWNDGASRRISVELGTPGIASGIDGSIDDSLITQEFRFNYQGEKWKWVGGLYGSYQNTNTDLDITLPNGVIQRQVTGGKTDNVALFGEATYEFVPTWHATLGGRLDYLRNKEYQFASQRNLNGTMISRSNQADLDETNFVPKVALSKKLSETQMAGVSYTQGFRTGGYYINQRTLTAHYYNPEKAHSYELFYKGSFLDNRLLLNANLFHTKYINQQIEIRPDPNDAFYRETQNAASSRTWGFEIEPTWKVNNRLSTFASIGYLDTKFLEFDHFSYGDLSGQPLPEAPKWTVGLGGHYQFGNGFYVGGDAKYTSGYQAVFGIAPQDSIDSRIIVNAQTGIRRGNWSVNAFVENLLDERYYTGIDRDANPVFAQMGLGRSIGIRANLKF
ncbi:TonB-dependent receptor [Oxalicibacterium flavum]|uniref:TonB-dependent receptor n=1 Tax=Oxalicibacterium flavum TaxID=179467 RepID=A0A8J2UL25_9BURK|nr:TonB-dependent receptor [Oxalicibacterium flavum]GGC09724.1 TonB-dependent receptor [Oxalicibacterium flavum]